MIKIPLYRQNIKYFSMSISDILVIYYINGKEVIMEKPKKETLEEAYDRVFNYAPSIEEVEAKYDDDFNKWLDDLEV